MEREKALVGGNLGGAVRVGETVPATGPWTPAVYALLRYLGSVGFAEAPRVLGIDDLGREILTFPEGDVAGDPGCVSLRDEGHVADMQRTVAHLEATVGELQAAIA